MNPLTAPLSALDPEVHAALRAELTRRRSTLEMIASENLAPLHPHRSQDGEDAR